jgi:hypothetical protein
MYYKKMPSVFLHTIFYPAAPVHLCPEHDTNDLLSMLLTMQDFGACGNGTECV